jgi:hypothetical protein
MRPIAALVLVLVLALLAAATPTTALQLSSAAAARRASLSNAAATITPAPPPGALNVTTVPVTSPALTVALAPPPLRGIFDPSLLATGNATLPFILTYSAVTATDNISTLLALYSTELDAWVGVGAVNAADVGVPLPCGGGATCTGSFIHEVSSFVIDPADPARAFKVFTHSYIVTNGSELHYNWGHIRLWTAPSLTGPWAGAPLLGWASPSPLSTDGVALNLTSVAELADCLIFTEPGAILLGDALVLALGCVSAPPTPGGEGLIRVVSLSSADHGATWAYAGLLVDGADALALGFSVPQLNAAALFAASPAGGPGELLLSVTPAALLAPGFVGYCGCLVLRVLGDGAGGGGGGLRVARDPATGVPVVERAVVSSDATAFSGACAAAASAYAPAVGGFLLPTLLEAAGEFAILPSWQPPP